MKNKDLIHNIKSKIHPSEELVTRTKEQMRAEKSRKVANRRTKISVGIAAVLVIGFFAYGNINRFMEKEDDFATENHQDSQVAENLEDSSVNYSSLDLPKGNDKSTINDYTNMRSMCLKGFEESDIKGCSAIIEGTITKMYVKDYNFQTYSDKFEKGGKLNDKRKSVVYELDVDKVWYGGEEFKSSTYTIEDEMFLAHSMFSLKIGHKYVLPVANVGPELYIYDNYASGNITRDSEYVTIYPYQPQIEVTNDDQYIVNTDWKTLTEGRVKDIIVDMETNDTDFYYKDKMKLIHKDIFEKNISNLIDKYLK